MQEVKKILDEVPFGALATADSVGVAKITPLHFAADGENIYWFSAESAEHSQNLAQNPRVSFAVWTDDRLPNLRGVVVENFAKITDDKNDFAQARVMFAEKFGEVPAPFADYQLYVLPLGEIDQEKTANTTKFYLKGVKK